MAMFKIPPRGGDSSWFLRLLLVSMGPKGPPNPYLTTDLSSNGSMLAIIAEVKVDCMGDLSVSCLVVGAEWDPQESPVVPKPVDICLRMSLMMMSCWVWTHCLSALAEYGWRCWVDLVTVPLCCRTVAPWVVSTLEAARQGVSWIGWWVFTILQNLLHRYQDNNIHWPMIQYAILLQGQIPNPWLWCLTHNLPCLVWVLVQNSSVNQSWGRW